MKIDFPGRALVIQQVQRALRQKADGIDGRRTWQAIVGGLPLSPVPLILAGFPNREAIVARVQRGLGDILVDGHDGQETWSALAQRFDPLLARALTPLPPPSPATAPTGYLERVRGRTPNRNAGTNTAEGCVIHHASGYFEGTVSWCLQRGTEAGYHVLINTDGERAVLALDTDRAHHSGQSVWHGRSRCNHYMLGLAFIGNTNDGAMRGDAGRNLTPHEIHSAVEWLRPRMAKYGWRVADITAHRLVSPGRKDDASLVALHQITAALRP